MTSQHVRVMTVAGAFDRGRLKVLTDTLTAAENDGLSGGEVVMFEGHELLISFGTYLAEHVETELSKRDHGGL